MGVTWEESYTGQLRQMVGHQKLIIPSVRAMLCNEQGHALYIARRGEGSWGMPAGSSRELRFFAPEELPERIAPAIVPILRAYLKR
ncbi:hypothetical protein CBW65_14890 [Tumebacillus avium]|uniref:Nudix hydrolase domain-containing protein n=1 Tax=Tumebacillus avium TaxID=1903704 RepID=A0A1Y0INI8_9BACL|nr:hypothetical protein [Tumebacillus avium]ARU62142.1 hypothetical protein CBW65_14890 [Tumebacillus avium]